MNDAIDGALASVSDAPAETAPADGNVVVVNAMRFALEPVGVETVQEQAVMDVGSAVVAESMPGEVIVSTEETVPEVPVLSEGVPAFSEGVVEEVMTATLPKEVPASIEVVEQQPSESLIQPSEPSSIIEETVATEEVQQEVVSPEVEQQGSSEVECGVTEEQSGTQETPSS